ncbi:formimidoylglutamase [Mycetocola manganoxydans]|uniref:Formimidoylglutamase n=1 Tax=Mycetocola manganoxydans TaxID=699879 RepID=A0A3L6ZY75_9MICO|nr:arginase family protein [Mycetocola manganoxydans]RLP72867.1 formimidoylglutamase [Mycetocola manganoxydans]GHD45241.1 formimidoylglutamase [Mycetocola manganoxydans]
MVTPALPTDPLWPRAGDWPRDVDGPIDLALIGIPTWRTSLSPTSAHATPAAVRAALRRFTPFAATADGRNVDELVFADFGDAVEPDGPDGEPTARRFMADAVARSRVTVALGGDNAATVPAALGAWGDTIRSAGLVTLDAHHDLRDGISNGSPVRRLIEAGLDGRRVVQVGIADFANSRVYTERARDLGITVVPRGALHSRPMADVMAEALDIAGAGGGPVHVNLDVDVCDRSVAPGCPASVPGGIAAHELRWAARAAGADPRVRSVDITEVDALADAPDGRTVRLAALCVLEVAAGLTVR